MAFEDVPIWDAAKKGGLTPEILKIYESFATRREDQRKSWRQECPVTTEYKQKVNDFLRARGFGISWETGQLEYNADFKPVDLAFEVCYVRHGKTHGNTEPRIFQGYVDYWNNQLNEIGLKQAEDAADAMEKMISDRVFNPDIIFSSPLRRAVKTGDAFASRHPELKAKICEGLAEARFGAWDNVELRTFSPTDSCHLFYLDQNALVKSSLPHLKGPDSVPIESENFVELLMRQYDTMIQLSNDPDVKALSENLGRKPRVIIYGHSMAGAAWCFLLGHGKYVEGERYLGYDGPYVMKNATPTLLLPRQPEQY